MANHQHYDYKQSVIKPIYLEDQLVPGTLEHAIHYIVEERLDMSNFDARYNNDVTGRKSIDPKGKESTQRSGILLLLNMKTEN